MKRILLPVSLLLSGYLAYAQVGIGTKAPHISAILDLKADDRGLLVPQVQLKSLSDGSIVKGGVPHLGLLVFNTTSNATLRPGFYYWGSDNSGDVRGNRWIAIGDDVNASMGNKPKLSLKVENSSLVLGDNDGNIAAVPLVDLQVPTSIVADPINKGSYIYTNESRQTFRIDVVQDVITNFGDIIKEPKVINELNKFITNATGNVTVSKDPVTNNITISYKDNGNTEELHLTTEVKRVQNYGSLTSVAADKVAKTGKGLTFNNGKEAAGSFNESLTGFTTKTDKVTLEDGTQGDAVIYVYKDESTNDQLLPITADIAKTFKTIVNQEGNREYIENIVNNAVPSGFITNTAADQATKKGAGFTFNNGKEVKGSYVETVTSLERKETQTNLPDNKTGKSIKYEYKDETGKVIDITVTDDVASSFTTIINQGDNKTAIENIIKNLIKSEGSKVTVERNATSGDVTLVIVNDQNTERVNISAMIKDNAKNPWLVQGSANVATTDTENIAHTGTVAIGGNTLLSNPKATNTKLSVTGDVVIDGKFFSANSVYADYVFEKYFTGLQI
jgi:hypothetical protein